MRNPAFKLANHTQHLAPVVWLQVAVDYKLLVLPNEYFGYSKMTDEQHILRPMQNQKELEHFHYSITVDWAIDLIQFLIKMKS